MMQSVICYVITVISIQVKTWHEMKRFNVDSKYKIQNLKFFIKRIEIFILLLPFLFSFSVAPAQNRKAVTDSLKLTCEPFLLIGDSSIIILNDTVMILKSPAGTEKNTETGYEDLYNALKSKTSSTFITRELFSMAFPKPQSSEAENNTGDLNKSEGRFTQFRGRKIRSIRILKLSPFGTSVSDTSSAPASWFAGTANRLHTNTRDNIVRNNLLFKTGDTVNPVQLADNERILRELLYIRDARIEVTPNGKDSADVVVITKDVWSIALDGKYYNTDSVSIRLYDRNIFGTGQHIENDLLINIKDKIPVVYSGSYLVSNLFGSFITGRLTYTDAFGVDNRELEIGRDFLAHQFDYAGGLKIQNSGTFLVNENHEKEPVRFNYADFWLGRSVKLKSGKPETSAQKELFLALRLNNLRFSRRPAVESDSNYLYFNRSIMLATIALSRNNYFTGTQIYYSGQTEDIPYGYLLEFTFGKEFNEFQDRYYAMLNAVKGEFFGYGFLSAECLAGGFIHNDHFEQGTVILKADGFSKKLHAGGFAFRHFAGVNYTMGIKRFENENLYMKGESGIRGLDGDSIKGNYRLLISLEQIAFVPKVFYGFECALFTFQDMGFIGYQAAIRNGNFYSGFGSGIRINNENLLFRTLQLSFAYYPVMSSGRHGFIIKITTVTAPITEKFLVGKPEVISYE